MTRRDVAFKSNGVQLSNPHDWQAADTVELRFRAHKGDQKRLGAVLSRGRVSGNQSAASSNIGNLLGIRGGGLEVMIALMSLHPERRQPSIYLCQPFSYKRTLSYPVNYSLCMDAVLATR